MSAFWRWLLPLAVVTLLAAVVYVDPRTLFGRPGGRQPVVVVVPQLSPAASKGRQTFVRYCADCHGVHAEGGATGPPLVHPIYRPRHHADAAFALAVKRGVSAHHWRFGDMPAQPAVTAVDVDAITSYVRELQRANGVE